MNKKEFLLKLLPGFLPILIFIAADELFGTEMGLYIALSFGLVELAYYYIKSRKIEKFILLDVVLLMGMGSVSIILKNDIFFKLKPAIIEFIFVSILGISVFTPANIIMGMSKRYMKGMRLNDQTTNQLKKMLKTFFFLLLVHVSLVVYSAYYMSKEAWAFISSGGFYILFFAFILYEFIRNKLVKRNIRRHEMLPVVDEDGNVIRLATRKECHEGKRLLHPVVHLHLFSKTGKLFLQKRPLNKFIQPGKWDTSVGGHIEEGEDIGIALERECREELNLTGIEYKFLDKYIWETPIEKELIFTFIAISDKKPKPHPKELDGGRFWSIREIKENLGKEIFTPNFEEEYHRFLKKIKINI